MDTFGIEIHIGHDDYLRKQQEKLTFLQITHQKSTACKSLPATCKSLPATTNPQSYRKTLRVTEKLTRVNTGTPEADWHFASSDYYICCRFKYNLNQLSHDCAIGLIQKVLDRGVNLQEVHGIVYYGKCSKISNTSCLSKRPRQTAQTQMLVQVKAKVPAKKMSAYFL